MTLQQIYSEFQQLVTSHQRVQYLEQLKAMNLPYAINYDNLIAYWSTQ